MMNGEISLNSEKGEGSTFTVNLNNIKVIDSESIKQKSIIGSTKYFDINTILIVEDNEVNYDLVKYIIEKITNAKIIWDQKGKIGVEEFKDHNPDIILIDIHMPVMDGLEATVNIRDINNGAATPIIAVTAAAMKEDVEANELVFEDYLVKPITKNDVIEIFSKYFEYEETKVDTISDLNEEIEELNTNAIKLISDSLSDILELNKKTFDIDLAEELVKSLEALAADHDNEEIKKYANELQICIDNFVIEGFEQKLSLIS